MRQVWVEWLPPEFFTRLGILEYKSLYSRQVQNRPHLTCEESALPTGYLSMNLHRLCKTWGGDRRFEKRKKKLQQNRGPDFSAPSAACCAAHWSGSLFLLFLLISVIVILASYFLPITLHSLALKGVSVSTDH